MDIVSESSHSQIRQICQIYTNILWRNVILKILGKLLCHFYWKTISFSKENGPFKKGFRGAVLEPPHSM